MLHVDATRSRPVFAGVLLLLVAGCAGGENATLSSLKAAKTRWEAANIHDYELEWASSGPTNARYIATVREGKVSAVEGIAPDGRHYTVKPADPRYYGVEGLFLVIADELAQLDLNTPFGRPKGSRAVLKFTPDPKYGFPRRYRRDVVGAPVALGIDVIRFEPKTTADDSNAR